MGAAGGGRVADPLGVRELAPAGHEGPCQPPADDASARPEDDAATTTTTRPPVPPRPDVDLRGDGGADGSTKAETQLQGRAGWRSGDVLVAGGRDRRDLGQWPRAGDGRADRHPGEGRASSRGGWQVRDRDNDALLASGSGAGEIRFRAVALRKVAFMQLSSDGTPRVAEYEAFSR